MTMTMIRKAFVTPGIALTRETCDETQESQLGRGERCAAVHSRGSGRCGNRAGGPMGPGAQRGAGAGLDRRRVP